MPRVWQTLRRWLIRIGLLPDEEGIFYIGGSVVLPPPRAQPYLSLSSLGTIHANFNTE